MAIITDPPAKGAIINGAQQPTAREAARRKILYTLLAVGVIAVIVVVPVAVTQLTVHRRSSTRPSGSPGAGSARLDMGYCERLQGESRTFCKSYTASEGASKFAAASKWLKASQATCEY